MKEKRNGDSRGTLPRIPLPGQRIFRSVIAVWVCMGIYVLRGFQGEPFYSVIAALQCVQPYSSNMLTEGRERIIGTLIGAFWGSVILFADLIPVAEGPETMFIQFLLLGLFSGLVIYSTVLFRISKYALFSAVVFLGIAMFHLEDVNPYVHVFHRTMDTIIGVGVAIAVSSIHLPRVRDTSTLFISGVDHVLFSENRQISPLTKVEINRFLDQGMRFSVATRQTPASVREMLSEIRFRLPIIAMDGAVLYDLNTMQYVRTEKMEPDLVEEVTGLLGREGIPYFSNTVHDNLLVIYFRDYKDLILEDVKGAPHESRPDFRDYDQLDKYAYLAMARLYRRKRVSPYRNYVRTNKKITEDVVYLMVIDRAEAIDALSRRLMEEPFADRIRINFDTFDCEEGEKILRILSCRATRANMVARLQRLSGAGGTLTFGTGEEEDIQIRDADRGQMVRELRKRFSPVSLRGWRNIIRLK